MNTYTRQSAIEKDTFFIGVDDVTGTDPRITRVVERALEWGLSVLVFVIPLQMTQVAVNWLLKERSAFFSYWRSLSIVMENKIHSQAEEFGTARIPAFGLIIHYWIYKDTGKVEAFMKWLSCVKSYSTFLSSVALVLQYSISKSCSLGIQACATARIIVFFWRSLCF